MCSKWAAVLGVVTACVAVLCGQAAAVTANVYEHTGYDAAGKVVWKSRLVAEPNQEDVPESEIKRFEYDISGRLTAVVLPEVNDPLNNNEPNRPRYRFSYDVYGNLLKITGPYGKNTTFTYDYLHNQTSHTREDGKSEYKEYDPLCRVVKKTDFEGQITGYTYNNRGKVQYEKLYNSDTDWPDNPAEITEYVYNNLGRKTNIMLDNDANGAVDEQWDYYYDSQRHIKAAATPQGYVRYLYYHTGAKMESRYYEPAADLTTDVLAASDADRTRIRYGYDELNRLDEVETLKRNGAAPSPAEITQYGYDAAGQIEAIRYPNGNYAEYAYDALGRLKRITNYADDTKTSTLSSYEYFLAADGTRTSIVETDSGSNQTVIDMQYDSLRRLKGEDYDAPGASLWLVADSR